MAKKHRLGRRQLLLASGAIAVTGCGAIATREDPPVTPPLTAPTPNPTVPVAPVPPNPVGPPPPTPPLDLRGVVVEVSHPGAMAGGTAKDGPVQSILVRAMMELTGKKNEADAWKVFFTPSDVVGLKISPMGFPEVYSHAATLKAIIHGLNLAGIPNTSIVVFDRYKSMMDPLGYPALLPAGIEFAGAVPTYVDDQTDPNGYDPNVYVDLPKVFNGNDPNNPAKRRSHLANIVSNRLTKIINVPALKDHLSAGITNALKNMTYGMVNNVDRTHQAPENWTKDFVPAVATIKKLRDKVVLHVSDALRICYEGGPGPPGDGTFKTADLGALLVATDPVALDRVGWAILDAHRAGASMPPLASTGLKLTNPGGEAFDERQPQHVLTAGAAGLGESDLAKIKRLTFTLS